MSERLQGQLVRHEGMRLKAYKDTVGKLTIGVGRNLDDVGISRDEALLMLDHDIKIARAELLRAFPGFASLEEVRFDCLINMIFNLGITRFKKFKNTIAAIEAEDYNVAADEMLDSEWARQVGSRATELSLQMRMGYFVNSD